MNTISPIKITVTNDSTSDIPTLTTDNNDNTPVIITNNKPHTHGLLEPIPSSAYNTNNTNSVNPNNQIIDYTLSPQPSTLSPGGGAVSLKLDPAMAAVEVLEFRGGTLAFRNPDMEYAFQKQTSLRLSAKSFVWTSLPLVIINFLLAIGSFYLTNRFLIFFVAAAIVQMAWATFRPLINSHILSNIINYLGCTGYMILMSTESMFLVRGNNTLSSNTSNTLDIIFYGQDAYQLELGIAIFVVLVPVTIFRVQLHWFRWSVITWLTYYIIMVLVVHPIVKTARANLLIWLFLATLLSLICAYRLELLVRMFWYVSTNGIYDVIETNENLPARGCCTKLFIAIATGTCCRCRRKYNNDVDNNQHNVAIGIRRSHAAKLHASAQKALELVRSVTSHSHDSSKPPMIDEKALSILAGLLANMPSLIEAAIINPTTAPGSSVYLPHRRTSTTGANTTTSSPSNNSSFNRNPQANRRSSLTLNSTDDIISSKAFDDISKDLDENTRQWVANEVLTNRKGRYPPQQSYNTLTSMASNHSRHTPSIYGPGSISGSDKRTLARTIASIDSFIVKDGKVVTKESTHSMHIDNIASSPTSSDNEDALGRPSNRRMQNQSSLGGENNNSIAHALPMLLSPGVHITVTAANEQSKRSSPDTEDENAARTNSSGSAKGSYNNNMDRRLTSHSSYALFSASGPNSRRSLTHTRSNTNSVMAEESLIAVDEHDDGDDLPVGPLPHQAFVTNASSTTPNEQLSRAVSPGTNKDGSSITPQKHDTTTTNTTPGTTGPSSQSTSTPHGGIMNFMRRSSLTKNNPVTIPVKEPVSAPLPTAASFPTTLSNSEVTTTENVAAKYVNPKGIASMQVPLGSNDLNADWLESRLSAIARLREGMDPTLTQTEITAASVANDNLSTAPFVNTSNIPPNNVGPISPGTMANITGVLSPGQEKVVDWNNGMNNNNTSTAITHHHNHAHAHDGRDRDVVERLRIVTQWDFDVFEFTNNTDERPLAFISYELFSRFHFFSATTSQGLAVPEAAFTAFINKVEREYCFDPDQPNPYHTNIHAADVVQAVGAFLVVPRLASILDQLDAFSLIVAAIVHDFRHPGVNNNFLIKTSNPIAIRYNDDSVLENFHVAEGSALMVQSKYNIFANLTTEQRTAARFAIIKCVLSTDLAKGATFTNAFKAKMTNPTMGENDEEKLLIMQMMIKCADVSHPARALKVHEEWSARVSEEFYNQGDQERSLGMPISPLCDRTAHNLAKSQIGFIEFVVRPAFTLLTAFCEVETWMDGLKANLKHWKDLAAAETANASTNPASTTTTSSGPGLSATSTKNVTTASTAASVAVSRNTIASTRSNIAMSKHINGNSPHDSTNSSNTGKRLPSSNTATTVTSGRTNISATVHDNATIKSDDTNSRETRGSQASTSTKTGVTNITTSTVPSTSLPGRLSVSEANVLSDPSRRSNEETIPTAVKLNNEGHHPVTNNNLHTTRSATDMNNKHDTPPLNKMNSDYSNLNSPVASFRQENTSMTNDTDITTPLSSPAVARSGTHPHSHHHQNNLNVDDDADMTFVHVDDAESDDDDQPAKPSHGHPHTINHEVSNVPPLPHLAADQQHLEITNDNNSPHGRKPLVKRVSWRDDVDPNLINHPPNMPVNSPTDPHTVHPATMNMVSGNVSPTASSPGHHHHVPSATTSVPTGTGLILHRTASERSLRQRFLIAVANAGGKLTLPQPVTIEVGNAANNEEVKSLTLTVLTMEDVNALPMSLLFRISAIAKLDTIRGF